jgi:hypothetical protein
MPVKLPAPDLGTEAQPGPKSLVVVAPEDAGADDAGAEEAGEDADDEEALELHAVAVRTAQTARPEVATRRYFMISPVSYLEGAVR